MINNAKVKSLYELVTELGYTCCIAGSSVYRTQGVAGDIDVFVDLHARQPDDMVDDLVEELCMEGDFKFVSKSVRSTDPERRNTRGVSYTVQPWIYQTAILEDNDGLKINLIGTLLIPNARQSYANCVLQTFDYSICQIAYQGRINKTLLHNEDMRNKTLTLCLYTQSIGTGLENKRLEKLQNAFPGFRMKFADNWYRPYSNEFKYVRNLRPTVSKLRFIDEVAMARNKMKAFVYKKAV